MKFSIILTLIATLNVSASLYSQDTKLNLSVKDKTVKEVIKLIENQSNFRFFFSDDYLDLNKKVSLTAQNKNINEVLNDLLIEGSVTYKVLDNNVVVITPAAAQQAKVTGTVTDASTGETLPGVNVIVKGTTRGTTTDIDGKFTIEVNNGEVLVFSYVGYLSEEVVSAGQSTLTVQLSPDIQKLDEVVVVGYGVMKKSDLTGSVSSVKAADIAAAKSPNVLQVMQGKVSGLDITQSSGQAGSGVNILLRGNRSLNASNNPLIMVDGVEYGSTLDINPSDIESMEVLKDAASTAIYGTRGANGVILITTKKGGQGKTRVTFNAYTAFNSPSYIPDIMNSDQFKQKRFETLIADEENLRFLKAGIDYIPATGRVTWNQVNYPDPLNVYGTVNIDTLMRNGIYNGPNNPRIRIYNNPDSLITTDATALQLMADGVSLDYLDMIFKNSITQNYELGIIGGSEKSAYNLSLGFMKDNGLLRNDNMRRYNLKLGTDQQVTKFAKIGASVLFTNKKFNRRNSGIFNQALKTGTIGTLYNADGTYNEYPDRMWTTAQPNPMLDEVDGANINEIISNRLFSNGYVQLDLIKGLTFKSTLGVDLNFSKQGIFNGPKSLTQLSAAKPNTEMINTTSWSYVWDNILTYKLNIDVHDFQLMAGSSTQQNQREEYSMKTDKQQVFETEYYDWSFESVTPGSEFVKSSMISVFGRLNYKFNDKYLFQFTYRTDGASVLNKKGPNRWASFPSASVGWRLSQEEFLKSVSAINNLKLRFSWGIAGNASVQPYQSLSAVNTSPTYVALNNVIYSSYAIYRPENPELTWEKTTTYDLGLDFAILQNRISGSIDIYQTKTDGLIFEKPLPATTGYVVRLENAGKSEGKGIEISLNTINYKNNIFEWTTDWSFSLNREKIINLYNDAFGNPQKQKIFGSTNEDIWRLDDPLRAYYVYEKVGIYSIEDYQKELDYVSAHSSDSIPRYMIPMIANDFLPGDVKLYDRPDTSGHGDGIFNEFDKKVIDRSPKYSFGFTNNFTFNTSVGQFGLSVMVYGRIGQYIRYDHYGAYKHAGQTVENGPNVDAWTPTNTGADFPRYSPQGNAAKDERYRRALFFVDGSFIKIKDITLSYSLPKSVLQSMGISNLKIYGTAKNMFNFNKLGNYDTELGGSMNFPLAKQFIVGLNLEF